MTFRECVICGNEYDVADMVRVSFPSPTGNNYVCRECDSYGRDDDTEGEHESQ